MARFRISVHVDVDVQDETALASAAFHQEAGNPSPNTAPDVGANLEWVSSNLGLALSTLLPLGEHMERLAADAEALPGVRVPSGAGGGSIAPL